MAQYTTTIRTICESIAGQKEMQGYDSIDEIIDIARAEIFDFQYDFYEPEHKINFEKKFLLHYYMREIGLETYGYWKLRLRDKFLTIMPYIKKLYEQTFDINYFDNVDYRQTIKELEKENSSTNRNDNTNYNSNIITHDNGTQDDIFHKDLQDNRNGSNQNTGNTDFSDNSTLNQNDNTHENKHTLHKYLEYPESDLDDFIANKYLTNVSDDSTQDDIDYTSNKRNNTTSNTTQTNDNTYIDKIVSDEDSTNNRKHDNFNTKNDTNTTDFNSLSTTFNNLDNDKTIIVKGKKGGLSYIELISMYQKAILNYDEMIFLNCEDLFMQTFIW